MLDSCTPNTRPLSLLQELHRRGQPLVEADAILVYRTPEGTRVHVYGMRQEVCLVYMVGETPPGEDDVIGSHPYTRTPIEGIDDAEEITFSAKLTDKIAYLMRGPALDVDPITLLASDDRLPFSVVLIEL